VLWNLLTPMKVFSANENRYLAKFPMFTMEDFVSGEYMKDMDEFINDQFVLRDQWIGVKVFLERALLKREINSVFFAKDEYLIENHKETDVKKDLAKKNKEVLREFMERCGALLGEDRMKVMLVPTASEILKDKLSLFAAGNGYDQFSYIDEVKEELGEKAFLDIRETLLDHREEYISYRTDHHWTSLGAYYAYVQWAKEMGMETYSEMDFQKALVTDDFYGTLHSKVNVKVKPDEIYIYKLKNPLDYKITYNMEVSGTSLYDYSKLSGKDKYSVFMGGNNALVEVETKNQTGRKLLVIKDSFAHTFVPFAVNHYDTTYMVDLRYYNGSLSDLMEEKGITDVLVLYNVMGFVKDVVVEKLLY
jgi:hypothetical protein